MFEYQMSRYLNNYYNFSEHLYPNLLKNIKSLKIELHELVIS